MGWLIAMLAGVLVGGAVHSILRRDLHRICIGITLLTTAVNLVVFSAGRLHHRTPIFAERATTDAAERAFGDPLPQAFVLTAIVIGLGVIAFLFVLLRVWDAERRSLDVDARDSRGDGSG